MIWSKAFFEWYTHPDKVSQFRKAITEEIFSCIELNKIGYFDVIVMPVKRLRDLLKWKIDLESEREKLMKEKLRKR